MVSAVKSTLRRYPVNDLLFFGLAVILGFAIALAVAKVDNPLFLVIASLIPFGAILVFYRPEYGMFLMVFIAFTRASSVVPGLKDLPSITLILSVALAFLIVLRRLLYTDKIIGWQRPAVFFISYAIISGASMLWAADTEAVQDGLIEFGKDVALALMVAISIHKLENLRTLVWVLLLAGMFLGSITIIQTVTGDYSNEFFGFGTSREMNITEGSEGLRSVGPDMDPNSYGLYMVMLLPLALDRVSAERKIILRLLALLAIAAITLAVVFTFSRGAFIVLVLALGLYVLQHPPKPWMILAGILVAAFVWQYIPPEYTQRMATLTYLIPGLHGDGNSDDTVAGVSVVTATRDVSFRGRLSENIVGIQMSLDHPLLGVGFNNFSYHYLDYSSQLGLDNRREGRAAHNLYLEIWAEQGIPGLVWFFLLNGIAISGLYYARMELKRKGLTQYASLVSAFAIATICFLFGSIFRHLTYPTHVWLLYGIILAVPGIVKQEIKSTK